MIRHLIRKDNGQLGLAFGDLVWRDGKFEASNTLNSGFIQQP